MENSIDDEWRIGEKDQPAEIPGNLANKQLLGHGQQHHQNENLDQPGHGSEDHFVVIHDSRDYGRRNYCWGNPRDVGVCHEQEPVHGKDETGTTQKNGWNNNRIVEITGLRWFFIKEFLLRNDRVTANISHLLVCVNLHQATGWRGRFDVLRRMVDELEKL